MTTVLTATAAIVLAWTTVGLVMLVRDLVREVRRNKSAPASPAADGLQADPRAGADAVTGGEP